MYNKNKIEEEALKEVKALHRLRQITPVTSSRRHVHIRPSRTGTNCNSIKPVGKRPKIEDIKL